MSSQASDVLQLDIPAAHELVRGLGGAADELHRDRLALEPMLDAAGRFTGAGHVASLRSLDLACRRLVDLATDLHRRVSLVERTQEDLARVDALTLSMVRVDQVGGAPSAVLEAQRAEPILRLVGGDAALAARVREEIGFGRSVVDALAAVDRAVALEARVASVAAERGIGLDEAAALVERVDDNLATLRSLGHTEGIALGAVALLEHFSLDLDEVLRWTDERGVELVDAIGHVLTARALEVDPVELDALGGLERHFAVFDDATGRPRGGGASIRDGRDGRVSIGELEFVVEHPDRFTPAQVSAARALLAQPALFTRLDTAAENTDILGGARFGRAEPGDGLVSADDLAAFVFKTRLHQLLAGHADRIDVANDPSGTVDGHLSEGDFRAFLEDNPDLPDSVRAAAEVMIANGWFDESWWQRHKDELAMGAALLAGGIVVVGTGGSASLLLVAGAGAAAAGGTTIAVNAASDDDLFDDVVRHSLTGLFVGAGMHGVAAGASAYATSTSTLGRSVAIAKATSGSSDVVAAGALDLVVPEEHEARVHDAAGVVGVVAGGWDLAADGGYWITSRMARFETLDEQLAALATRISRQKQGRHIDGAPQRVREYGGYFRDPADAQAVLDAVHDRSADIIGRTRHGDILVRVEGIEGFHMSTAGPGFTNQPTDTFMVKGTARPSVVPTTPGRLAEAPATPQTPRSGGTNTTFPRLGTARTEETFTDDRFTRNEEQP